MDIKSMNMGSIKEKKEQFIIEGRGKGRKRDSQTKSIDGFKILREKHKDFFPLL